jgi:predicted MFS family arabinose efflux permease
MVGIDLLRAAAMVPLLFGGPINSNLTYAIIVVLSLSQPVFMSAQVSFLRSVTPPANMVSVLRNISNIDWTTYVVGMAIGAFLIAHLSIAEILLLNAGTFIVSGALLALLRSRTTFSPKPVGVKKTGGSLSDLKPLYGSFLTVFALNLGAGIINVYPVVRSTTEQAVNQSTLSTIVIINGVFGLIGALSVKPIYQRIGALKSMTVAAGVLALSLFAMALDAGIVLAVASSSLMLGTGQVFAVSAQTHMVSSVGQDRAGKLSGIFQCCTYGGIALNGVLFSLFSESIDFGYIVSFCAVSAFVAFAIALRQTARHGVSAEPEGRRIARHFARRSSHE